LVRVLQADLETHPLALETPVQKRLELVIGLFAQNLVHLAAVPDEGIQAKERPESEGRARLY